MASSRELARLLVALEVQTAKYEKGLQKADRRMKRFQKSQNKLLKKIDLGFKNLGRAATSTFAILGAGSLAALVKSSAAAAENLELMANRLGVSARELQAWQLIAERANVPVNSLNTGIQRLTRRSAEAAMGMGEAKGALKELRIDAQAFNALSLDDRMTTLARAFSGVESEADKVRLAFKLFDTEGVGFLQFLKDGESGLKKLRRELDDQLWSDEERAKLANLNRELTKLGQTLRLSIVPALISMANVGGAVLGPIQEFVKRSIQQIRALLGNDAALQQLSRGARGRLSPEQLARLPGRAPGISPTLSLKPLLGGGGGTDEVEEKRKANKDAIKQLAEYDEAFNDSLTAQQQGFAAYNDAMLQKTRDRVAAQIELEKQWRDTFSEVFVDNMVMAAETGFKSILNSWARTLQQMLAKRAASKLFDLFMGEPGSEGGGLLGSIFKGFRAGGGPVTAGGAYVVGERGPELFTPRVSGSIIPNGGANVFNIDARGASPGVELRIRQAVSEAVSLSRQDRIESGRRGRR